MQFSALGLPDDSLYLYNFRPSTRRIRSRWRAAPAAPTRLAAENARIGQKYFVERGMPVGDREGEGVDAGPNGTVDGATCAGRPGARSTPGNGESARQARGELCDTGGCASVGRDAMLAGGVSPMDGRIAEVLLSVPAISIAGGIDKIQRNNIAIAERVLGLPKDPQNDADVPFRQIPRNTSNRSG